MGQMGSTIAAPPATASAIASQAQLPYKIDFIKR
jgi:hypothetical protein